MKLRSSSKERVAGDCAADAQMDRCYIDLLEKILALRDDLLKLEQDSSPLLQSVHPRHRSSAANLLHYLSLRRCDVRPLQQSLADAGLSSLGRAESHVLHSLNAIADLLQNALHRTRAPVPASLVDEHADGYAQLEKNALNLLGQAKDARQVRVMVTIPGEMADDYAGLREMLLAGMDCARINCAHDDRAVWEKLIAQIRHASRETGRECRVLMDLAGPKLRTGSLGLGPAVIKWRPRRDAYGHVLAPARIWLHPEREVHSCPAPADACVPVVGEWLKHAALHDRIEFTDARGAKRSLELVGQVDDGFWAESSQTTYLRPGLQLHLVRVTMAGRSRRSASLGHVGALPRFPQPIRLHRGDMLVMTRTPATAEPAQYDDSGRLLRPAHIACSLPQVFSCVKPGERVLIDDGRIGGVISSVSAAEIAMEITAARDGGEKLLADKGINLPDSNLDLAGLTEEDLRDLDFVVGHADLIGLSFVRDPAHVDALRQRLIALGKDHLGVVLKIETRAAFDRLPDLLLELLHLPSVGVMIARGDLAVECGYERMAELQEEILWLAEAAHLPVIWATQVLEGLARDGKPSRAEITDAAMSVRAECVMLNKGPHIVEAIRSLGDILRRMQGHQHKKRALLRKLHW